MLTRSLLRSLALLASLWLLASLAFALGPTRCRAPHPPLSSPTARASGSVLGATGATCASLRVGALAESYHGASRALSRCALPRRSRGGTRAQRARFVHAHARARAWAPPRRVLTGNCGADAA